MIIYRATFSKDDTFYRCDECGKTGSGRDESLDGQKVNRPPVGWIIPRRSREMFNPQVTNEIYCGFPCLYKHDGIDPELASGIEPPSATPKVELAKPGSFDEALRGAPAMRIHGR
jgi:hypothetical protein